MKMIMESERISILSDSTLTTYAMVLSALYGAKREGIQFIKLGKFSSESVKRQFLMKFLEQKYNVKKLISNEIRRYLDKKQAVFFDKDQQEFVFFDIDESEINFRNHKLTHEENTMSMCLFETDEGIKQNIEEEIDEILKEEEVCQQEEV